MIEDSVRESFDKIMKLRVQSMMLYLNRRWKYFWQLTLPRWIEYQGESNSCTKLWI